MTLGVKFIEKTTLSTDQKSQLIGLLDTFRRSIKNSNEFSLDGVYDLTIKIQDSNTFIFEPYDRLSTQSKAILITHLNIMINELRKNPLFLNVSLEIIIMPDDSRESPIEDTPVTPVTPVKDSTFLLYILLFLIFIFIGILVYMLISAPPKMAPGQEDLGHPMEEPIDMSDQFMGSPELQDKDLGDDAFMQGVEEM